MFGSGLTELQDFHSILEVAQGLMLSVLITVSSQTHLSGPVDFQTGQATNRFVSFQILELILYRIGYLEPVGSLFGHANSAFHVMNPGALKSDLFS